MSVDDATLLARMLPTYARVSADHAEALPGGAPAHVYPVAAIALHVDAVHRSSWKDDVELAERLFAAYPKGAAPAPVGEASHKRIDDDVEPRRVSCMNCVLRPGESPCARCHGRGLVALAGGGEPRLPCGECGATGFAACTVCEGTRVSVVARVEYVNDQVARTRCVLVPELPNALRETVERLLSPGDAWPEACRFELEPTPVGSAYRGAAAVRDPDFHGHYFGYALARALSTVRQAEVNAARLEVRAYGIAMLWLVYGDAEAGQATRHFLFVPDVTGALHVVAA